MDSWGDEGVFWSAIFEMANKVRMLGTDFLLECCHYRARTIGPIHFFIGTVCQVSLVGTLARFK